MAAERPIARPHHRVRHPVLVSAGRRDLPVPALSDRAAPARIRPVLHRGLRPLGLRPGAERPVAGCDAATSQRWRRSWRRTASAIAGRFAAAIPDGRCYGMSDAQILRALSRGRRVPERDRRAGDSRGAPAVPRGASTSSPIRSRRRCRSPTAIRRTIAALDGARHAFHVRREHRPSGLRRAGRALQLAADAPAGRHGSLGARIQRRRRRRYTTITTWHNKGKDIVYRGDRYYWTKDREFEKFLDLPRAPRGAVRAGRRRRRRRARAPRRERLAPAPTRSTCRRA